MSYLQAVKIRKDDLEKEARLYLNTALVVCWYNRLRSLRLKIVFYFF